MENKLLLPEKIVDSLPSMVRKELSKLSPEIQEQFVEEYKRKAKSVGLGYLLWFIGFHYLYFKEWGTQILFWITGGGLLVWYFIDLFRIGRLIKDYNKDVAIDTLRNLKAIAA